MSGGKMFRGGKMSLIQRRSLFEEDDSSGSSESEDEDVGGNDKPKQQQQQASANLSSDDDEDDEDYGDDKGDDNDDDDDDEEEEGGGEGEGEGEGEGDKPSSRKRARDEDDDEEDEEEEEDLDRGNKKAKQSKVSSRSFFDEEAEADDDEEEDDEPYGTHKDPDDVVRKHYTDEDIRKEYRDEEAEDIIRRQDRRRQQAGGRFGAEDSGDRSVADITREIERRHEMSRRIVDRNILDRDVPGDDGADGYGQSYSAVSQQSLVPSVSDPSLWMFNCSTGKEQELVYQIMNKCVAFARQGKPLGITGCIAAQSKGRIYLESFNEIDVNEAVQGVRNLMAYSKRLVPINDMTTVLTVVPKKKPVKKNDWVRMNRGHFKGDLALVKSVRDSGLKCVIQCVPRLDLTLADLPPEEAKIRRRTVRPPQRFYNPQEVAALGRQTVRQRFPGMGDIMCDFYEGNYYHDGYLLKEVTVGTMVKPCSEDEPPTLDELQRFRRRQKAGGDSGYDDDAEEENEGSKIAGSLLSELSDLQGKTDLGSAIASSGGGLIIGDTIEVIEGDLVGMQGKIISLDGTTVKVKPNNAAELGDMAEVEFLANQVRKYIPVGAHVKVTDGRYANETGVVVAVEQMEGDTDCTAVVLTDMTHKEVSVRTSQLQESAEIASGQDKLAGYELHDLVVLSGGGSTNEVGVIVRVGREEFTVINNHGIVREVRPEELRGKRNASSSRAVALDVQANQIRVGDTVSVAEGPHKGKTATIKRMSRAQLFLYSQTRAEHAGIFVVRSRSCVLAGARAQNRGAATGPGESPFSTPRSQTGGGPAGGRGKRDDGLIGKTVRIQAGQWKGYLGAVSDATATHVQVELHSRLKKVMVVRERVAVVGDKFGATEDPDRANPGSASMITPSTPFLSGGATPMHGGATPMHGGATPMHDGFGGATPSHSGNTDDVWRPGGSIDRAPGGDDDSMDTGIDRTNESGWGSNSSTSAQQESNPFSSSSTSGTDGGGGWGAPSGSTTWTPSTSQANQSYEELSVGVSTTGSVSAKQDAYERSSVASHAQSVRTESDMGTTMGDDGAGEEAAVWFMERVCVQLKRNEASAVIKEINADKSAVVELEDKTTVTVRPGEVSMVPPQEHDMVLVTGGADVGVEGELVCIDGTDAILKESNENFKIVDFVHLAKIESGA